MSSDRPTKLHIRVPATSANLGPGFDMFGVALKLYTHYHFEFSPKIEWRDSALLDRDGNDLGIPQDENLILHGFQRSMERYGGDSDDGVPGFSVRVTSDVPFGRGFGSSASALVAGVTAADFAIRGNLHSVNHPGEIGSHLQMLNSLEGHPDNVAPARLGGFIIGYQIAENELYTVQKRLPDDLGLAVMYPDFRVSTTEARNLLPERIPVQDCVKTITGALLWREYLDLGDPTLLVQALKMDRLHEPFRGRYLPAFHELRDAAADLGLYGVTISGSGPSLLLYFPEEKRESILRDVRSLLDRLADGREFPLQGCGVDYTGMTFHYEP